MPTLRLASLLHLHPSTVTGILDRLQQAGLVARVSDPTDARRSRLRLTARGQALNRVDRGTVESAVGAALERLSPATIAAGRELLRALSAALDPDGSPRARPASRQRARRS
jgi:DNA-binding MarR family transcriptional regulator